MPILQINRPVNLRICQAPTFALPCKGVIEYAQFSSDTGKPMRNWAKFRPLREDGSLGEATIVRMYKLDGVLPNASEFGWVKSDDPV